jgi:hypothetical protein
MKTKYIILLLVLVAVGLSSVYAGNARRIGTAGAAELLIPVGSRGSAMGGAVLSTTSGVESIHWNPAGLADLEGTEVMFTHQPYLADIDVNFVGVATRIEDFGTLGVSAKVVSIGDMEETTREYPEGTGRIYSPSMTVLGLSYAKILTANVSVGATVNFIREEIFEANASGVAFDIGFQYIPRWRGLSLGFTIKNYGPEMEFNGAGFDRSVEERQARSQSAPFDMPSSFNLGLGYDFLADGPHLASLAATFRSNNYQEDFWQGGLEYSYNNLYFLRAGYNFSDQDDYLYGASVGAGLSYQFGETRMSLEYSWTQTEVFDDNQYFTVKLGF